MVGAGYVYVAFFSGIRSREVVVEMEEMVEVIVEVVVVVEGS